MKRASKYRAVPTAVDGITFASKREAAHYSLLRLLERNGDLTDLELQPVYPVTVNGKSICKYVADFRYRDKAGRVHIEDVKGVKTPIYRLKKKLVEAIYSIQIEEVQ